jgi:heterodisulfide reductase subunit C
LEVLDRVFLVDPKDSYYSSRREHGVVVTMACTRPTETCFCQTFGIDASAPKGDIECYKTDSEMYFNAVTEKGKVLLEKLDALTEDCDSSAVNKQKEEIKAVMNKLPLKDLKADAFGKDKTEEFFDRPEWKTLSESCLGCGTCTFVCPTCQCYDIKDFNTGHGVKRFRCWDSCMYSDFTKMSAGQPRVSQVERFRQRFMHKLVYFPTNNDGMFSCVGCGRCVSKCPISMNIVKVMKTLKGEN